MRLAELMALVELAHSQVVLGAEGERMICEGAKVLKALVHLIKVLVDLSELRRMVYLSRANLA
jgi:hypothetical protein